MSKHTTQQSEQEKKVINTQTMVNSIFSKIVDKITKYAPIILFSLWAILLWAFYSANLTTDILGISDANLYRILKYNFFENDLLPICKILVFFSAFSNLYILILALIHWLVEHERTIMFANIFGVILQAVIFVCTLVVNNKIKELGIDNGAFVLVVTIITGIFALLSSSILGIETYRQIKKAESPKHEIIGLVLLLLMLSILIVLVYRIGNV